MRWNPFRRKPAKLPRRSEGTVIDITDLGPKPTRRPQEQLDHEPWCQYPTGALLPGHVGSRHPCYLSPDHDGEHRAGARLLNGELVVGWAALPPPLRDTEVLTRPGS